MKNIEIEFCERLPPGDGLDGILSQFYELAVRRLRDMGLDIAPALGNIADFPHKFDELAILLLQCVNRFQRMRGRATVRMRTEEILALTRAAG